MLNKNSAKTTQIVLAGTVDEEWDKILSIEEEKQKISSINYKNKLFQNEELKEQKSDMMDRTQ